MGKENETAMEPDVSEEISDKENVSESSNDTNENTTVKQECSVSATDDNTTSFKDKIKTFFSHFTKKKVIIPLCSVAGALIIVYIGGVIFYSNHFFYNTYIGNFKASNLTSQEAKSYINDSIDNYTFTFHTKDGGKEVITGDEIHLEYSPVEDLTPLLDNQNPFEWFFHINETKLPLDVEVTFSNDTLYNRITELDFSAKSRDMMDGSTAGVYYENGKYQVRETGVDDVISVNDIYHRVKPKIKELYQGMSLVKENCYGGLSEDDKMTELLTNLNRYVSTKVTFEGGTAENYLDGDTIHKWITVNDDYTINFNKDALMEYVHNLASVYDTIGSERKFKTSKGEEVTVSGGDYGFKVDREKEAEALYDIIMNGETISREPIYKQTGGSYGDHSDINDTYVEISIANQHLWYYKNGEEIVSSDLVSGNTANGNGTPSGVYKLKYKDKDVVLRGEGYASPVTFWMPFNGGIGMHDASWRGSFGGSIYRGSGSHGCINLPYSAASKIYENIEPGTAVVVY